MFWEKEKPEAISEKRLKGPKVTGFVACVTKHSLLGPYWFEENERTFAINCERYVAIVDQFYVNRTLKLSQRQFKLAWLMLDGARPYTAHPSLDHLRGTLPELSHQPQNRS